MEIFTVTHEEFRNLSGAEKNKRRNGYQFTGYWLRSCFSCKKIYRVKAAILEGYKVRESACSLCGHKNTYQEDSYCSFERVWGRENIVHECGPKCYNAQGPSCDCSCAGANHGSGHPIIYNTKSAVAVQ